MQHITRPPGSATRQAIEQFRLSRWWEPVRNLLSSSMVVAAFWMTVHPAGDVGRATQLGLAVAALTGVVCAVWLPRTGVIISALATGTAWLFELTFDPFVITGIALFTVAERRAARLFPRMMIGSIFLLFLMSLAFAVDGFEDSVRGGLLSVGVLAASWVLGARTRQVRREVAARSRAEERLRLARDVHDVLSHSLATIGVRAGVSAHVATLNEDSLRETLREIEESARVGMSELNILLQRERDADSAVAVTEDDEQVSSWSLSQTLAGITRRAEGAGVQVSLDLVDELDSLPATMRTTIHRVVQEALTNVVRHSSASDVAIRVGEVEGDIEVRVSDNGTGRTAALCEGNGLTGMRERTSLLGGNMIIEDHHGGGISIIVKLPVSNNARTGDPR